MDGKGMWCAHHPVSTSCRWRSLVVEVTDADGKPKYHMLGKFPLPISCSSWNVLAYWLHQSVNLGVTWRGWCSRGTSRDEKVIKKLFIVVLLGKVYDSFPCQMYTCLLWSNVHELWFVSLPLSYKYAIWLENNKITWCTRTVSNHTWVSWFWFFI